MFLLDFKLTGLPVNFFNPLVLASKGYMGSFLTWKLIPGGKCSKKLTNPTPYTDIHPNPCITTSKLAYL